MKRYSTKRVYQVRCKSGLMGWRTRLQNNYRNFSDWAYLSDMWGLCYRLGFNTARAAWKENPVIEGSVSAGDFRKSS